MLDIPIKNTYEPPVNKNPSNNSYPIPHRYWEYNDRAYSVFSSFIPDGAVMVRKGWTVKHIDGTTGLARKPFDTEAEAQAWCDANPKFSGMGRHFD